MERGLRMLTVAFPYLAGLAAATRVTMDDRVPTMGVFASGRLIANAQWVARLNEADLQFVLAHEMLHLALRTHDRARGADHKEFNIAHDYIINDLLRKALQRDHIPAGGLDMPGASTRSAEEIVLELRRNAANQHPTQQGVWDGDDQGDVLSDDQERTLYPGEAKEQAERAERIKAAAVKSLGLAQAVGALGPGRGSAAGAHSETITALRGLYRTPWQQVLQRWLKSIAPAERSFHRPSRRARSVRSPISATRWRSTKCAWCNVMRRWRATR